MGHAVSRIKVGPENKGQPWARGKLSAGMLYICYTLHICMYYIYVYIRYTRLAGYLEQSARDALIL